MAIHWMKICQHLAAALGLGIVCWVCPNTAGAQAVPPMPKSPPGAAITPSDQTPQLERRPDDRPAVRGVREQDEAAARTANQLNRDARQEVRQAFETQQGAAAAARNAASPPTNFQSLPQAAAGAASSAPINPAAANPTASNGPGATAAMSAGLRGADLGLWLSSQPGANGLVVADVAARGAFATAGFRDGDRIVSINGQPVTSEAQFIQLLTSPAVARQSANIAIERSGGQQTLSVQPAAVMQGVAVHDPLFQAGLTIDPRTTNRVVIQQVYPRTPAFYAGLRAGDVITSINGSPVASTTTLTQALQNRSNLLALQINRNGQTRQLSLESEAAMHTTLRPTMGAGASGASGLGASSTGSQTTNQVDPSGLGRGGVTAAGSGTIGTTVPGNAAGGTLLPGAATAPVSPLNPGPLPGTTVPGGLPGAPGLAPGAIGSPSAVGATGTTGGTGSTAAGAGAVGGTGAISGGTGSTAGPSGGSPSSTGAAAGSGIGAGAGGTGAGGAGSGGGAGTGGSGGAGGGGAGAGGT